MRTIWICTSKDLRKLANDPMALLVWIGVPVFIALLMSALFGRSGNPTPKGTLLIADHDRSIATNLLLGAFNQGELAKMITVEQVDEASGRKRIGAGEVSALLVIPAGFGDAVLTRKASRLSLVTNPSQRIMPNMMQQVIEILLDAGFYIQKMAGEPLGRIAGESQPSGATIAAFGLQMNRIGARVAGFVNPPRIELETQVIEERKGPPVSFATVMLPGMIFMGVMFVAGGLSGDLWKERTAGTLRRFAATPGRIEHFLAAKSIATGVVMLMIGVAGLLAGAAFLGAPVSSLPLGALWVCLSGIVFFLMMLSVQVLAANQRAASLLGSAILLPLTMLGGGFFPLEQMPPGMARIGRLTPNGWALTEFRKLLTGSAGPELWIAAAGLAATGAVLFLFISWRMRKRWVQS